MSSDDWKLDSPPESPCDLENTPFRREVGGENGVLCWHIFALTNLQENAPDWAWEACKRGPFTSTLGKLIFRFHVVIAQLEGKRNPLAVASFKSIGYVDEVYFDACSEIEDTWRQKFSFWSLRAIQESDYTINLYPCDIEKGEY